MGLRMSSPMRPSGSWVHYLRKRVPADLLTKVQGVRLHVPVGEEIATVIVGNTGTIKVSLRTNDPRVAKERQAKALAYLDDVWRSLREGPRRLTHRQVIALAGQWYSAAKKTWEDDPGRATPWGILSREASEWDDAAAEYVLAPFVTEFLGLMALEVDEDTQRRLALAMRDAVRDASALLERRGRGDYGPDTVEQRFPHWEPNPAKSAAALNIAMVFGGWERESRAAGLTEKTISEYKSVMTRFAAFLENKDATLITPHDVVAWKDKRLADGLSPKTVKDVDLAAMKSVFGWAVRNHKLPTNPAQGVTIKLGKRVRKRSPGFTDEEATAILSASFAYTAAPQEHAKTAAAKKWLPWLCAYSGARIGEVAQLRRADVQPAGDHWIMTITPEAGPVKNKEARRVPLHPHLVELGFTEFVKVSGDGYLFLTATGAADMEGRLKAVKNRVTEFVRTIVDDNRIRPNHAWRHRLITLSRRHGVDQELRRMITGHAGEGVDEAVYGEPEGLYREVCKLPRYQTSLPADVSAT